MRRTSRYSVTPHLFKTSPYALASCAHSCRVLLFCRWSPLPKYAPGMDTNGAELAVSVARVLRLQHPTPTTAGRPWRAPVPDTKDSHPSISGRSGITSSSTCDHVRPLKTLNTVLADTPKFFAIFLPLIPSSALRLMCLINSGLSTDLPLASPIVNT